MRVAILSLFILEYKMGANLSEVSNNGGSRGGLNNPESSQDDYFVNQGR